MAFGMFCPKRRNKTFMTKPVAVVTRDESSEFQQRPLKLRTLIIRQMAILVAKSFSAETTVKHMENLPSTVKSEIFHRIRKNYESSAGFYGARPTFNENIFIAWCKLFNESDLELDEFLGDHWSRMVFQHIVHSEDDFPSVKSLTLTSREVNQERLCFLFELTESRWKPELRIFLSKLTNITRLTVNDFVDDDTVSIIGRVCLNLKYLNVSLGPESFSEQQLSDDGFSDLIESQIPRQTLCEVDISNCFTSAVTAKTVLNFSKLKSVVKLHVMWSHFIWIDLSLRFLGADFEQNLSVKQLTVKFGYDSCENSRYFNADQGAINFVSKVFPALVELRIFNLFELETREEIENLKASFGSIIKSVSIKRCKNLEVINEMLPNVEQMELGILMCPDTSNIRFSRLHKLVIFKDMFAIDFQFIHDVLANCEQIKIFKIFSLKVTNYNEERFIKLFSSHHHLKMLEELSLNFRTSCPMTAHLIHFLVETCPNLHKIDNLLSWNLSGLNPALLASQRKALVVAGRSHWSLPWKSEDGCFYDVDCDSNPQGCVTDMFDNR